MVTSFFAGMTIVSSGFQTHLESRAELRYCKSCSVPRIWCINRC